MSSNEKMALSFIAGTVVMAVAAKGERQKIKKQIKRVTISNVELMKMVNSFTAHISPEGFAMVKLDTEFDRMARDLTNKEDAT
jgi:16S rRNA C967 or C1407 C5-methylase (RsmB/RsmF family)